MKKSLFTSIILGMLCASGAFAEKGGGYIGIDIGHGTAKFDQYIDATTNVSIIPNTQMSIQDHIYASNSMPNITLKGGYKTFFGDSRRFGVRGYVYFGYGYKSMQNIKYTEGLASMLGLLGAIQPGSADASSSIFTGTGKTYYNHVFDYGVGGDLLYNFIDTHEHSFGVYGGVSLGAETWVANGKEYKPNGGKGENYFTFQTMINAGVRGVFNEHHGIEFGVKFPLLASEIFNGNGHSVLLNPLPTLATTTLNNTTTTMKRPYIIHASYVYNF